MHTEACRYRLQSMGSMVIKLHEFYISFKILCRLIDSIRVVSFPSNDANVYFDCERVIANESILVNIMDIGVFNETKTTWTNFLIRPLECQHRFIGHDFIDTRQ